MRSLDENVPGVERVTPITGLGARDVGHVVTVEGRSGSLMEVKEVRTFKGSMPVIKYRLKLWRLGAHPLNQTPWFYSCDLDGSDDVTVGRKYVPGDTEHPPIPSSNRGRK